MYGLFIVLKNRNGLIFLIIADDCELSVEMVIKKIHISRKGLKCEFLRLGWLKPISLPTLVSWLYPQVIGSEIDIFEFPKG
jgi:hypothetical protein